MVNPDSDLYRAHPDWAMHFPGRPRTERRNQLVLNMARDDVQGAHLRRAGQAARRKQHRFLKWDMNRSFSEPGWPAVAPAEQQKLWVQYVRQRLRDHRPAARQASEARDRIVFGRRRAHRPRHPDARRPGVDLGQHRRVRPAAHPGRLHYGLHAEGHDGLGDRRAQHERARTPLEYRFLVAMKGSLGIGANLNHWSRRPTSSWPTKMIACYKRIRATVQNGDLYRLLSPRTETVTRTSTCRPTASSRWCSRSCTRSSTGAPAGRLPARPGRERALPPDAGR